MKMAPEGLAAHSQSLAPPPIHHGQTNSFLSVFTAAKYCPIESGGMKWGKERSIGDVVSGAAASVAIPVFGVRVTSDFGAPLSIARSVSAAVRTSAG